MRATPYTRVLKAVAACAGLGWPVQVEDAESIRVLMDQRLGEAWEYGVWPEWEALEQCYIRPEWSASVAYALNDEVYSLDQGRYYQALGVVTAGTLVTDTAKWAEFTPWMGIPYDAPVFDTIGEFLGIWDANPRLHASARPLDYELSAEGADLLRFGGNTVWVKYRQVCPRLEGAEWAPSTTYALGDTVYCEDDKDAGNFYTSLAAANLDNFPDTTPAKWAVIGIPYILEKWLAKITYADWLGTGGAANNSAAVAEASALYFAAQDKIIRQQGQMPKIRYQGY